MARVYATVSEAISTSTTNPLYSNEDEIPLDVVKEEPLEANDDINVNYTSTFTVDHCQVTHQGDHKQKKNQFHLQTNFSTPIDVNVEFSAITIKKENDVFPETNDNVDIEDRNGFDLQVDETSTEVENTNDTIKRKRFETQQLSPRKKLKRSAKTKVHCKTCSLPFADEVTLRHHEDTYRKDINLCCNICYAYFSSKQGFKKHNNIYHADVQISKQCHRLNHKTGHKKYFCHFCNRNFVTKYSLQCHLFHIHDIDAALRTENSSTDTSCKKITQFDVSSVDESPKNVSDTSNGSLPTKLRQRTLPEFFSTVDQKSTRMDDNSKEVAASKKNIASLNESLSETTERIIPIVEKFTSSASKQTKSKPFVKIHVNPEMMETLLSIPSNNEKSQSSSASQDSNNSNTVKNYNLRLKRNTLPATSPRPKRQSKKNEAANGSHINFGKTCTIRLVRCDQQISPSLRLSAPQLVKNLYVRSHVRRRIRWGSKRRKNRKTNNNNTKTFEEKRTQTSMNSGKESSRTNNSKVHERSVKNSAALNRTNDTANNSVVEMEEAAAVANSLLEKDQSESTAKIKAMSSERRAKLQREDEENEENLLQQRKKERQVRLEKAKATCKEIMVSLIKLPINVNSQIRRSCYCKICKRSFVSKEEKEKHCKVFHTAFMSSICKSRYSSKRKLLQHYLSQHCLINNNNCCVCGLAFPTRLNLKKHLLLHCIKIVQSPDDRFKLNSVKCESIWSVRKSSKNKFNLKLCLRNLKTGYNQSRSRNKSRSMKETLTRDVNATNIKDKSSSSVPVSTKVVSSSNVEAADTNSTTCGGSSSAEKIASTIEEPVPSVSSSTEECLLITTQESESLVNPDNNLTLAEEKPLPVDPVPSEDVSLIEKLLQMNCSTSTPQSNTANESQLYKNDCNEKYLCSICGMKFKKLEKFRQHMKTYFQSFENYCTTCGIAFSSNRLLNKHVVAAHQLSLSHSFLLHCKFCNHGFDKAKNLQVHELHYHYHNQTMMDSAQPANCEQIQVLSTKCNVCSLVFETRERFMEHSIYYYGKHMFKCSLCDQMFEGMFMLNRHYKLIHCSKENRQSYSYVCEICEEGFNFDSHFHAHRMHVHLNHQQNDGFVTPATKKRYACRLCNIFFGTADELLQHMEYYSNDGVFHCPKCYRKCLTVDILKEHIDLNHGVGGAASAASTSFRDNAHKCGVCGDVAKSAISLFSHQKHFHFNSQFGYKSYPIDLVEGIQERAILSDTLMNNSVAETDVQGTPLPSSSLYLF